MSILAARAKPLKIPFRATLSRTYYWLDLGNNAASGQYVLGQPLNARNRRKANRLRTISELYPEIADADAGEDPLPSCSAVEALDRQEPFINQTLAASALAMLAQLFRYGKLAHHGAFFNAKTGQMCALPVDPALWSKTKRADQENSSGDPVQVRFFFGSEAMVGKVLGDCPMKMTFDPDLAMEAKALVALAFRNGPIEDLHAGKPCPSCSGQRRGLPHLRRRDEGDHEVGGRCSLSPFVAAGLRPKGLPGKSGTRTTLHTALGRSGTQETCEEKTTSQVAISRRHPCSRSLHRTCGSAPFC